MSEAPAKIRDKPTVGAPAQDLDGTEGVPLSNADDTDGWTTTQKIADLGGLSGFAYDPDTSDLPNGEIGITGGVYNSDNDAGTASPVVLDLSLEPNGTYFIYVRESGEVTYANNSTIGSTTFVGIRVLYTIDLIDVVISNIRDRRTWVQTSFALSGMALNATTLANLADEEAAKGTTVVIDANNISSVKNYELEDASQSVDIGFANRSDFQSDGGAGEQEVTLEFMSRLQHGRLVFAAQTDPADEVVFDPTQFTQGSDTITDVRFTNQGDIIYYEVDNNEKLAVDTVNTTAGAVTATAITPTLPTVGASPYKYTNDTDYVQVVSVSNIAGISALKKQRGAGTQYNVGLLGGDVTLFPGDNVEATYAVTVPVFVVFQARSQ